ncbi:MAG: energy transducer TonB [Maribacter sp.]|nr:MAG: energy transducer TonB [Maribacter sp.]
MKPKKNPNKDENKNRSLYFFIGLALAMLLTYVALEWKTYDTTHGYDTSMNVIDELIEEVPIIKHFKTPPPPPPPVAPEIIEVISDDDDTIETIIVSTESNHEEPILKIEDIQVEEIVENPIVPWITIEDVPVFPGCENEKDKRACFQKMIRKHINKNFRYPKRAQEIGLEGKVHTMFIIQKDGSIGQVQMRGPHKALELEAARIINKLPKMKPGKQRGNPVKVPFTIPITFKLQ